MPAPEMVLAKASAHAHRIRLGTSVISVPFHHPFHVAERMAFLDHLTRGRAILGVGPCALVTDKKLFGLPNEKLYPMMAESVDIIVRLLETPEPIDYDGRFWSFKQMRLQLRSYQQPRMPLAIASSAMLPRKTRNCESDPATSESHWLGVMDGWRPRNIVTMSVSRASTVSSAARKRGASSALPPISKTAPSTTPHAARLR